MHSVRLWTWSGWRRQWWSWVCSSASGAAADFVIALDERKPSLAISRVGEEVSETTHTASYSIRHDSEPGRIVLELPHGVIMPSLTIRHLTTYRYRRAVAFGEYWMMLHPPNSHNQRVVQADLKISPKPKSLRFVRDAFGNHVGIARFSRRSKEVSFESFVRLEHSPREITLDLEDAGRAFPAGYRVSQLRHLAPYIERHQHDPMDEVGRWARRFLLPSGSIGAFELLTR